MTTPVLEGGLLGPWPDEAEMEYRAHKAKTDREGAKQQAEQRELERAAEEFEARCDKIEAVFALYLKDQLAAENSVARITDRQKADFARFQEYCRHWGWPDLPSVPAAVATFLARESDHHAAVHISRLRNSISTIHRAVQMPDPCEDILVRAFMRLAQTKTTKPQKENDENGQ
jgi:hypothetical protein